VLNESKKIFPLDLIKAALSFCLNKTQENTKVGKRAAKGVGTAIAPVLITQILG
jgi:hypothetical protein